MRARTPSGSRSPIRIQCSRYVAHGGASLDQSKRIGQPPGATIGLERHAVVLEEITPRPCRVDAHAAQVRGADARRRIGLESLEQPPHPGRGPAVRVERPATLAGPVTREHRLAVGREELDVLRPRLARRARGPAEDARRLHAGEEHAVVARVPAQEGAAHLTLGRQVLHGGNVTPPTATLPPKKRQAIGPIGAGGRIRRISVAWPHRGGAHDRRDSVRLARPRGRSERAAAAQDDRDRHEALRARRGHGGDPAHPSPAGDPHDRPDRQHGVAAGLDRRHHGRRPRRRAMPRGDRPRAPGRSLEERPGIRRRLARHGRGRAPPAGGVERRAARPLPRPRRESAGVAVASIRRTSAWSTRRPAR